MIDDELIQRHKLIVACQKLATKAHTGQFRKYSGTPYIVHPARVARLATLAFPDETAYNMVIIEGTCWCHDVIEDAVLDVSKELCDTMGITPGSYTPRIVSICEAVCALTKPDVGLPRFERNRIYFEALSCAQPWIQQIKLLDRMDNILDLDPADGFTHKYLDETVQLMVALGSQTCTWAWQQLNKALSSWSVGGAWKGKGYVRHEAN